MASQVLSGTGNVSYTNNTGQNVRVVINYMASRRIFDGNNNLTNYIITISWAGVSATANYVKAIGRNLAFNVGGSGSAIQALAANNMAMEEAIPGTFSSPAEPINNALPTEIMLAAGQTFSGTCESYNIVIIPENG